MNNTYYRWVDAKDELPEKIGAYIVEYPHGHIEFIGYNEEKGFYYGTDRVEVSRWLKPISIPVDIQKAIEDEAERFAKEYYMPRDTSDYAWVLEVMHRGATFALALNAAQLAEKDKEIAELKQALRDCLPYIKDESEANEKFFESEGYVTGYDTKIAGIYERINNKVK